MLISVHLPKTAGSSFARTLEDYHGDKFFRDYGDTPLNVSPLKRNMSALKYSIKNLFKKEFENIECIHGHFMPLKYLSIYYRSKDIQFITWLRDPVERLVSHYYYWNKHCEQENKPPLHQKMVEERWTLEQFCLSPELRNTYHKFLWGFPMRKFSFIGITEFYDTDLEYFSQRFLGSVSTPYAENIRTSVGEKYNIGLKLREKIEQFHQSDVNFYHQACFDRLERRI